MSQNQSFSSYVLLPAFNFNLRLLAHISSTRHDIFILICIKELFPQILLLYLRMVKILVWTACKITNGTSCIASNDIFETSVSLRVCLFNQNHPQLSLLTACEIWLIALGIYDNVSINFIQFPRAINAKPNQKISCFNVSIFEKPLNEIRILSQTSEGTQKITISETSLQNIVRVNAILEKLGIFYCC